MLTSAPPPCSLNVEAVYLLWLWAFLQISQGDIVSAGRLFHRWRSTVCCGIIYRCFLANLCSLLNFFFLNKQQHEVPGGNGVSDSSVTILVIIMISILTSGEVFEVYLVPWRASEQPNGDGVSNLFFACQSSLSNHPWYPPVEKLQHPHRTSSAREPLK